MKVVFNGSYQSGFCLTEKAILRCGELKGLTLYPEWKPQGLTTYWTVPPEQRHGYLQGEAWRAATLAERKRSNEVYMALTHDWTQMARHDPVLIQVIEELGAAAVEYDVPTIAEIPDGSSYEVIQAPPSPYSPDYSEWISFIDAEGVTRIKVAADFR
jgi:hypothetical protein